MGDFSVMQILAEWFAWRPYRCGLIALTFSVWMFLPFYKTWAKMCFAVAALGWWWLTYTESTTPHDLNIRVDLVFTLPVAMFLGVIAIAAIVFGRRRNI
jgi:hypothetical protein